MAEPPFTDQQREVLEQIEKDAQIAAWLNARRESPAARFLDFLSSPETLRTLLAGALIPLLGWAFLSIYVNTLGKAGADAAAHEAQSREDIDEVAKLMPFLAKDDPAEKISEVVLRKRAAQRGPDSIISSVVQTLNDRATLTFGAAAPAATNALPATTQRTVTPQEATTSQALNNPFSAPSIVYIQIYGQKDLADATKVSKAFQDQYIPVAQIEDVLKSNPNLDVRLAQKVNIAVRYYHAEDKAAADFTAALIAKTLNRVATTQDLSIRNIPDVKSGTIEVWFPYPDQS